jgi:hypothetical protein
MIYKQVASDQFTSTELHAGERVEAEMAPGIWLSATVLHDLKTKVAVRFDEPILMVEIAAEKTITHRPFPLSLFSKPQEHLTNKVSKKRFREIALPRRLIRLSQ